jgi:hypothetical protein
MKHRLLPIRFGCSVVLLLVLTACGLPSAEPPLPSSVPVTTAAPQPSASAPVTSPPAITTMVIHGKNSATKATSVAARSCDRHR